MGLVGRAQGFPPVVDGAQVVVLGDRIDLLGLGMNVLAHRRRLLLLPLDPADLDLQADVAV